MSPSTVQEAIDTTVASFGYPDSLDISYDIEGDRRITRIAVSGQEPTEFELRQVDTDGEEPELVRDAP